MPRVSHTTRMPAFRAAGMPCAKIPASGSWQVAWRLRAREEANVLHVGGCESGLDGRDGLECVGRFRVAGGEVTTGWRGRGWVRLVEATRTLRSQGLESDPRLLVF